MLPVRPRAALRRPPPRRTAWLLIGLVWIAPPCGAGAADAQRFDLESSDGMRVATWLYPRPEDADLRAAVILVHDLDGEHKDLEPLAHALQQAGCTVAVPDLRGHGASAPQGGRDAARQSKPTRRADLEMMAAGAGGRLRAQSSVRGDLETVHALLLERGDIDASGDSPLAVVGCGAGATLAALWTAADWAWPPLASGPQGQHVRALVLVSPHWTVKGMTIQPALASEPLKQEVPIMILGGKNDRDATRLFDQLRKQRPDAWHQRIGSETTRAADRRKPDDRKPAGEPPAETLFLFQLDTTLSGEKLAEDDGGIGLIVQFLAAKFRTADR